MRHERKLITICSLLLAFVLATAGAALALANTRTAPPDRNDSAKYEAWLGNQVRHELVMLPWYSVFDNLEYRIEGSRVVLSGQVVRPTLRSDAEARVKKIEGVTAVDNRIEVLPLSSFDDRLRVRLYRAIYSEPMLSRYSIEPVPSIHIIVRNGHATLEGVVATEAEKNFANIRANTVPGVFSVTNHLQVKS